MKSVNTVYVNETLMESMPEGSTLVISINPKGKISTFLLWLLSKVGKWDYTITIEEE